VAIAISAPAIAQAASICVPACGPGDNGDACGPGCMGRCLGRKCR
jgi:hypothetical protein